MSIDPYEYEREEALSEFIEDELARISQEPVFDYLARHGDSIELRVHSCRAQARALLAAGFSGAALVRATAGIEITIRFFLVRPLLQGAFLSDAWAQLVSKKLLQARSAEDRALLPAILRNWQIEITSVKLSGGAQAWQSIVDVVWPRRNDYVHRGSDCASEDAEIALECLQALLDQVVDPLAARLGFTRSKTGRWCEVAPNDPSDLPGFAVPYSYPAADPFSE